MAPVQIRFGGRLTRTTGTIACLCAALFVAQVAFPGLVPLLGLAPGHVARAPWTLLTYAFLHGSLGHILFNLLTLYFFGGDLDLFLGRRRFLLLYLGGALTGGVVAALFLPPGTLVIGASGALYALLAAYALYFPETEVLLWFVLPIKIRILVGAWIGVSLFYSVFGSGDGVAHLAHLGGAAFAVLFVYRAWRPAALLKDLRYRWRRRKFTRIQ